MAGLAKLSVLGGCLCMVGAVILRITLFPLNIAGYAVIPSTLLHVANNFFLLGIALSVLKCPKSQSE